MTMQQNLANIHKEYIFSSESDLLNYLRLQDMTFPTRTQKNRKYCIEKWGICRLLATWAKNNYLTYPLKLIHRDRPDFLLSFSQRKNGIEFSEAISQNEAGIDALAEQMGKDVRLFSDLFNRGTPRFNASKKKEIILNQPSPGPGYGDDGIEREWALNVADSINDKTKDFKKSEFQKFDINWLFIYSNLHVFPREIKRAMKYLLSELENYWSTKNRYDALCIETINQLVEIHEGNWDSQPIVNLWG